MRFAAPVIQAVDLSKLSVAEKDALILSLLPMVGQLETALARIAVLEAGNAELTAHNAELQARLVRPTKTPDNSSTSHQVEHQTIEQQLDRLTVHVQMHAAEGWVLDPTHVFRDEGYSGAILARPGLDRLRDAEGARD
jgi:hypothetical protein